MGREQVDRRAGRVLAGWFNALASKLIRRSGAGNAVSSEHHEVRAADIQTVASAFQDLVSRVNREGNELSDLYLKAEKRAAGASLLNHTIVESVSSGIVVIERGGTVRLVNSSARDLLRLGADMDVTGRKLGSLFLDGRDLEALVEEDMLQGKGSSRRVIQVMTLDARNRQLGVSTSCVRPDPDREAHALIAVFTVLEEAQAKAPAGAETDAEHQGYLRGVLDSYDLMSGLLQDFGRIEEKSAAGSLTKTELAEFSTGLRGTCDTMMAFALSLEASSSLTELVDVNGMIDSILRRRAIPRTSHAKVDLCPGLPRVKTIRKVLETGLELLIVGSVAESAAGIAITTGVSGQNGSAPAGGTAAVEIRVSELGQTRPLLLVKRSLRELAKGKDLRREAGMYLLASLPREGHLAESRKVDGLFNFSVRVLTPINRKAGKSHHRETP